MKDEEHQLDPQLEKAERIAYLIAGFIRHTLTPEEHDELDAWVEASPENMQLFEELTDEQKSEQALRTFQQTDTSEGLRRLHEKIHAEALKTRSPRGFSRQLIIMAAAAVLVVAVSSILFFSNHKNNDNANTVTGRTSSRAYLRMAAGDTIWLDAAANGNLAVQGNTQIVKDSGLLSYHQTGERGINLETVMNTLATERGGQYSLLLPDGTRVWLNAASSISFPTAFTGRERKVTLVGEAYFEVAKDALRPFQVWVGNTLIEALGTHFNINAYGDEDAVRASLVDGSVRVVQGASSRMIRPGEEAQVSQGSIHVATANLARATGWHNGRLVFSNTALPTVARELSRWYDVDIAYRGRSNLHISIIIDRGLPLEKVIKLLEGTGNVHFKHTGDTYTIE